MTDKKKALKYRVIAITGAGSGIGRALVKHCLELGAYVAASDISEASLQSLEAELKVSAQAFLGSPFLSTLFLSTRLDVADNAAVRAWAQQVVDHFGYVDAIINNAGVSLSANAMRLRREDFEWLFNINFWGVVNGTEAFLPHLLRQPSAHVVNISSLFGLIAVPTQAAYNAAKFAVRGYSEALRQDLAATKVRVVTVHPGGVKTNIAKHGRHFDAVTGGATNTAAAAEQFARIATTTPERAAEIIVAGMRRNRPRVLIGRDAYLLDRIQRWFPARYDRLLALFLRLGERLRERRAE